MVKKKLYVLKKNDYIKDIIINCPKAVEMLIGYGFFCFDCPLNQFETLEQGAAVHQISKKQLEKIIGEVNKELKKDYEKSNH